MDKLSYRFWAMESQFEEAQQKPRALDVDEQGQLLSLTLKHPLYVMYPPSNRFVRQFIKNIITKCEDNQTEVVEDLYTAYVSLLETVDQDYCYKTYWPTPDVRITLKGTDKLISMGTTGLQTWPAGPHLAEYLIENQERVSKRCVIELGSGLGLTGITVVKYAAPAKYIFSDCHPVVLSLLQENIKLNLPDHHDVVCVKKIDWSDDDGSNVDHFDLILAADVLYDPDIITHLVHFIAVHLRRSDRQALALVASTVRNSDTYAEFESCLGRYDLQSKLMPPPTKQLFHYDRSAPIKILQISAKI